MKKILDLLLQERRAHRLWPVIFITVGIDLSGMNTICSVRVNYRGPATLPPICHENWHFPRDCTHGFILTWPQIDILHRQHLSGGWLQVQIIEVRITKPDTQEQLHAVASLMGIGHDGLRAAHPPLGAPTVDGASILPWVLYWR